MGALIKSSKQQLIYALFAQTESGKEVLVIHALPLTLMLMIIILYAVTLQSFTCLMKNVCLTGYSS
jgi:hypothetical protein